MSGAVHRVNVLGRLEAVDESGGILRVRGGIPRRILYLLVIARGRSLTVEEIIDRLWGERVPHTARAAVHVNVSRLRDDIGSETVITSQSSYQLEPGISTDLADFETAAAAGRTALTGGDPASGAVLLREALDLWRGAPFEGAEFDDALLDERQRLEDLRTRVLADRIECDMLLGRHLDVITQLRMLCDEHPLNERHWRLLMLALYRSGSQSDALRAFADAERMLGEELGIEPGPEMRTLEQQILLQDPALLGAAANPTAERRHNLKAYSTATLGRESQIDQLTADLMRHRAVTVVGPGGIGKTRIAIEAAWRALDRMPDGVWLVDLDPAETDDHVAALIQDALRIRDQASADAARTIVDSLRNRQMVLVLDNCELVATEVAQLVEQLLDGCPRLRVLTTSRRPLGIDAEIIRRIAPLPDPPPDDPASNPAVQLFLERASAVRPDLDVDRDMDGISQICTKLDGIPLAIVLAAAQVAALSVGQIRDRLDGHLDRLIAPGGRLHRRGGSLAAAIGSTIELLDPATRTTLARLTVFKGSFTVEAATAVCGGDVVDQLVALVRTSLLDTLPEMDGEVRYRMLNTIREFAGRILDPAELEGLHTRHARYMTEYAEELRTGVTGPNGPAWLRRGLLDRPNLIAALEWALRVGDRNTIVDITWSTRWLSTRIGRTNEVERWLDRILADRAGLTPVNEMRALTSRAAIALLRGSSHDGLQFAAEGLKAAEEVGDDREVAVMKVVTAGLRTFAGDFASVPELIEEGRQIAERLGDRWTVGWAWSFRGTILRMLDSPEEAREALYASLSNFEAIGDEHGRVLPLVNLGHLAIGAGDLDEALARARAALAAARSSGDTIFTASAVTFVARVLLHRGESRGVRNLLLEGARLLHESMNSIILNTVAQTSAWMELVVGNVVRATFLAGIAEGIRASEGLLISPSDRSVHDMVLAEARLRLGDRVDEHLEAGRRLDDEQALAELIATLSAGG